MSRASDAAELERLLARLSLHARLARVALARVPDGGSEAGEAWLDALDQVREVLDLATGIRVRFSKWSDEANGVKV